MYKRLFLAVDLPFRLKQFLIGQQKEVERQNKKIKSLVKWSPVENLHITVFFLGNIKVGDIQPLIDKLSLNLADLPALDFELTKIALAPPGGKRARMIWAYFESDRNYLRIVETVWRAVGGFILAPNRGEIKPPLPHVTIARFRQPIEQSRQPLRLVEDYNFQAKEIALWESKLGGPHSVYTQLTVFKLKI